MSFKDWLDKMEAEKAAENRPGRPEPAAPGEEAPPDPYAHLIGRAVADDEPGLGDRSRFDVFLDEVEAGKPEDFAPTIKASEHHDWQQVRAAVYSQDDVTWLCGKCCRSVSVRRDETVGAALERTGLKEDCSLQVVTEVQDT